MAGKDSQIYRKKLLKFLVALRDVGMETKYHIYDNLPYRTKERKKQFIALAIVSKDEILCENFAMLENFTDNLHATNGSSLIVSKVVQHDRVAVAMNVGNKYFFEHGECRLFDPKRRLLFKIIDEEILSKTGRKKKSKKIVTFDKGGHGVLGNMKNAYTEICQDLSDAVLLLYSFYIPCSLDFHNCARLIHEFVKVSGHEMVIGYERVYQFTDPVTSLEWLNMKNITVISNDEIKGEIHNQVTSLMINNKSSFECTSENELDFDYDFVDYLDDIEDLRREKHLRQFGKGLCRRILKEYNNFL